ncbi:MAG: SPFH domain-containing protein [Lachnospiraceae bacterium]|nr:SPFH domain-containing protein [Lachnospiraceae bacterium]
MGLIAALAGAAGGVMADQWKEYFYCDAIPADTLVVKGQKRAGNRSTNTKGGDNIISNGSVIAVADGQCMIIVDQGKVAELCAQPGEFVYDSSTEPSIFAGGSLATNILDVFKNMGKRFTFGGEAPKDQRVYYFNTKEIIGNKYGTPSAVPFRVVDQRAGIDIDISIRCFGEYSYKVTNPIVFYTNVCGNVSDSYKRDEIDSQLKSEFLTALQPAFARISEQGIRYSALPGHTQELADAMRQELSTQWGEQRGIEVFKVGVSSVKADEEDEKMLKDLQKNAAFVDPNLRNANLAGATMTAMNAAANNQGGAAMAFMGMNMAQMAGGNAAGGFAQADAMNAQMQQNAAMAQQQSAPAPAAAAAAAGSWTCPSCGKPATGKFCPECGAKKPEEAAGWTCSCGAVNKGRFCSECGAKKPEGAPLYKCDKCGWEPEDPKNPPKFCPQCGDPFGDEDIVS